MTEVSVMSAQDEACKQEQEVILDSATIGETLKMQHQTLVLLFLSLCDDKTFSKKKPKITGKMFKNKFNSWKTSSTSETENCDSNKSLNQPRSAHCNNLLDCSNKLSIAAAGQWYIRCSSASY